MASHPVRVRGLKQYGLGSPAPTSVVAPRAGAWIETSTGFARSTYRHVAPRAGAWIETLILTQGPFL